MKRKPRAKVALLGFARRGQAAQAAVNRLVVPVASPDVRALAMAIDGLCYALDSMLTDGSANLTPEKASAWRAELRIIVQATRAAIATVVGPE